jgi:serine/threonine protein kinase
MADGRGIPDEARARRTTGVGPTAIPSTYPNGTPIGETLTPGSASGSLPPTGTFEPGSSGDTRAVYASPRMNDPNEARGHSEQVRMLFGKYLVVRKLGDGAMGEVWLVRHRDLGAERALKLINLGRFSDPEMRSRARREARAMGLFSHPNAVAVHDANADGDLAYIEMEYIRGVSLNKVLEPGVPKPLDWVARMVDQLCAVLEVAHSHGIVHRDLKPSNMMLLDSQAHGREHLKILDFGIAKILHADERGHDDLQTRNGATIGTPAYMSPEQIDSDANRLDGRSDLYSVGVILFEMLTGRRPFTSASFKLTYDHLYTPPPSFSEVNGSLQLPEEVEKLVLRCLEKDPNLRPQSARELGDEFRRLAAPPKAEEEAARPLPRRRGLLLAFVVLMALTLGGSLWLALRPRPFTIRAAQPELRLAAGDGATITIMADGGRPKMVDFQPDKLPPGISVTRENRASNTDVGQFAMVVDPNVPPGVKTLSFRAIAGKTEKFANIRLTVDPPKVKIPDGFSPAPGSRLVQDDGRIYPSQIERDLGDDTKVEFLFIKRTKSDDPASFYIMRDKVSNRVFARFATNAPEPLSGTAWRRGTQGDSDLPAVRVTAEEACRFADWLGRDRAKVRLPKIEQWDKASGRFDASPTQLGPFLEPWKAGDKTIAVGRDAPAPVGSSPNDISPFGCRDMAGNGNEWTRNSTSEGVFLPFDRGISNPVYQRGQSFKLTNPLMYSDLKDSGKWSALYSDQGEPDVGFRLVIDEIQEN